MPSTVSSFALRHETRNLTYPDHLHPGERLVRCRYCREPDRRGCKPDSADQRRARRPNCSWKAVISNMTDSVTVATAASSTYSRSRATTASTTTPAPRRSSTTRKSLQEPEPSVTASASTLRASRRAHSSTPVMALQANARCRLTRLKTAVTISIGLSRSMLTSLGVLRRASRPSSSSARCLAARYVVVMWKETIGAIDRADFEMQLARDMVILDRRLRCTYWN
jgi:hypothetical protein